MEIKSHWEKIYSTKSDTEVSWFQEVPATSLNLIKDLDLLQTDAVLDVGGGNSNLTFGLFEKGYNDLTILDISGGALKRMQQKLGSATNKINWIESDILEFKPAKKYRLWHDRATFHFLTNEEEQIRYKFKLKEALEEKGYFILSTFSTEGPTRCSGLDICQYNLDFLSKLFGDMFELIKDFKENHNTPLGTTQNFIFTVWRLRE